MDHEFKRAATSIELPADGDPPQEILLLPAGTIETRPHDGREAWHNPDADAVVAATSELRLDLAIDYEHQSARAERNGQPAPAAGWIKRVFARDGAVWGEVEWTKRAADHITSREYRFISPTFLYHQKTRVVQRLVGAALTNDPALYMQAVARAETPPQDQEESMDLEQLRKALGLSKDANDEAILAATEAATAAATGLKAVAKAAGLEDTAKPPEIEAAVTASASTSSGDPGRFVPREEYDRTAEALNILQAERVEEKATAAVDAAVEAGKISPAQRNWALGYARKDLDGFKGYASSAPVIIAPGRISGLNGHPRRDPEADLDSKELGVCKTMGLDPAQFKETRKRVLLEREAA